MTTRLTPMRAEAYEAFADAAIESHSNDKAQSGRWPFANARQALYRSAGYGITGMNMLKPLRRDRG